MRETAREKGLTLLADATCPFVLQQEEAEIELLNDGRHLVLLSSPTHHGVPRIQGIARTKGKEVFIVEHEDQVDSIHLTRFEPIGVIVQDDFLVETYKKSSPVYWSISPTCKFATLPASTRCSAFPKSRSSPSKSRRSLFLAGPKG